MRHLYFTVPLEIFSKDIQADAAKLVKGSLAKTSIGPTIVINSIEYSPAKVFSQLQVCGISLFSRKIEFNPINSQTTLYMVFSQPALVTADKIRLVLVNIRDCICTHTLPDTMHRTAGFMTLQLALLLIARRSELITKDLVAAFLSVWTCASLRPFTTPPIAEEAADPHERAVDTSSKGRKIIYIFQDVLSIYGLSEMVDGCGGRQSFAAMELLLVELLAGGLLTIEHINQQCVRFLRVEWPTVRRLN